MKKIITNIDIYNIISNIDNNSNDFDCMDLLQQYLKLNHFILQLFKYQDLDIIEQSVNLSQLFKKLNDKLHVLHVKIAQRYNIKYDKISFLHNVIDSANNCLMVNGKLYKNDANIDYLSIAQQLDKKIRSLLI